MKKFSSVIVGIIIILAFAGGFICSNKISKPTHEYVYDTITHTIHDTIPKYTVVRISDTIPANIDTLAVIKAYYDK